MPFIEAFRQFQFKVGHHNFCNIHVSLVPEVRGERGGEGREGNEILISCYCCYDGLRISSTDYYNTDVIFTVTEQHYLIFYN